MATTIRVDISGALQGLQNVAEKIQAFRVALVKHFRIGGERFVYPRLLDAIPVRTGNLRDSRKFRTIPSGWAVYWDASGFYWRFQEGLEAGQEAIVRQALPQLISWAVAQARKEVGI